MSVRPLFGDTLGAAVLCHGRTITVCWEWLYLAGELLFIDLAGVLGILCIKLTTVESIVCFIWWTEVTFCFLLVIATIWLFVDLEGMLLLLAVDDLVWVSTHPFFWLSELCECITWYYIRRTLLLPNFSLCIFVDFVWIAIVIVMVCRFVNYWASNSLIFIDLVCKISTITNIEWGVLSTVQIISFRCFVFGLQALHWHCWRNQANDVLVMLKHCNFLITRMICAIWNWKCFLVSV